MSGWTTTLSRTASTIALLALCASLAGCKTPLDRAFGVSQREHVAQSIANPEAGMHDTTAPHPDGRSTEGALTKYRENEVKAEVGEPPPVININTGSK
jgi:hypothetical protein